MRVCVRKHSLKLTWSNSWNGDQIESSCASARNSLRICFSFLSLNVCVYRPFTVHCLLSLSILWETSSFFFFVFPDKHSENVFFWFGLEPQVRVVAWLSGTERCSPVSDVRLRWDTDRSLRYSKIIRGWDWRSVPGRCVSEYGQFW